MAVSSPSGDFSVPFDWSPSGPASRQANATTYSAYVAAEAAKENARIQAANELERAKIAAGAATAPEQGKNARFNLLLGMLGGGPAGGGQPGAGFGQAGGGRVGLGAPGYGGVGGGGGAGIQGPGGGGTGGGGGGGLGGLFGSLSNPERPGGQAEVSTPFPLANPWTPSRVSQEVGAMRAQNNQQLNSQIRNDRSQLSSRGFGSLTPQQTAMESRNRSAALNNSMTQERGIRNTANDQNAQQQARSAQLGIQETRGRGSENVERLKPYFPGSQSALLSSLFGAI